MWYMTGSQRPSGRQELLHAVVEHLAAHSLDNQSLRSIAAAIGTSHRMLLYHFGSREGLLAEVVATVEQMQREAFAVVARDESTGSSRAVAEKFWSGLIGPTLSYGPLFFELSAHAMQGRTHAQSLTTTLIDPWLDLLAADLIAEGMSPDRARTHARLGLATVRGLLFDLLITKDREGTDDAFQLLLDLLATARPASSPDPP